MVNLKSCSHGQLILSSPVIWCFFVSMLWVETFQTNRRPHKKKTVMVTVGGGGGGQNLPGPQITWKWTRHTDKLTQNVIFVSILASRVLNVWDLGPVFALSFSLFRFCLCKEMDD